jgi:hypothetical protein
MPLGGVVVGRRGKGVVKLCTQSRKIGTDEESSLGLRFVCIRLQLVSDLEPPRTTNEKRGTTNEKRGTTNNHERPVCLHDTQVNQFPNLATHISAALLHQLFTPLPYWSF